MTIPADTADQLSGDEAGRSLLQAELVEQLGDAITNLSPPWHRAFAEIDRGPFVPRFFLPHPDRPGWDPVEAPDPRWARGVYGLDALVTQVGGPADRADSPHDSGDRGGHSAALSSSSSPALMARMLTALDPQPGEHILEIGTGTGYNAALLCHRLGDHHVTTVDIDSGLVATARARLHDLGLHPTLRVGDGAQALDDTAPFDRVLATVAFPHFPRAWLTHLAPAATVLLPLHLGGAGGLLALLHRDPDSRDGAQVSGHFVPFYGGFMPLRAHQHHAATTLPPGGAPVGPGRTPSLAPHAALSSDQPFEAVAALLVGGFDWLRLTPTAGGPDETWLTRNDGSWACHLATEPTPTVHQGGPEQLWDQIETAHTWWVDHDRPARERFGMTATVHGQHFWLDEPSRCIPDRPR